MDQLGECDGASATVGRPSVTAADAARIARERFGVEGDVAELPSERDRNFRIRASAGDGFVLKVSRSDESRTFLEAQDMALQRLADALSEYRFPTIQTSRAGRRIEEVTLESGVCLVRMLSWLPGIPLARAVPRGPGLLERVGRTLGAVDRTFRDFSHPGAVRQLDWDLRRGRRIVAERLGSVEASDRRELVRGLISDYDAHAEPILGSLRTGVIHGDGNDHNVIVERRAFGDDPFEPRRVVGIVDFGDMVESWTVAELAVAMAYAMLNHPDPLAAAAALTAGYHAELTLAEREIAVLYPLATLRLCVSVVMSAYQRGRDPGNPYLSISEDAAWATLDRLSRVSPDLAHYRLRHACGHVPCPKTGAILEWIDRNPGASGPVLDPDPRESGLLAVDLSPGGLDLADVPLDADAGVLADRIAGALSAVGAGVGLGRHAEARRDCQGERFRVETDAGAEWRTIHLGVDLFVEPGSPVLAPLPGRVHDLKEDPGPDEHGPTVVLEHAVDEGRIQFYTIYGHLSPDSLADLEVDAEVSRGARIGRVGTTAENGGWAPHLHFQLAVDLLDHGVEFPETARPSERAVWLSVSPDPNRLLRLPIPAAVGGPRSYEELLSARRERLGPNLSLSYRRPLQIVRGWMQHVYDEWGQAYLDCVNNVAHVGHSHPRVVVAARRQAAVLNTNTRYLHENLIRYAERLTATLPEPLKVCYFACSGSEANELALRMARAHTSGRDVIVVEGAYHGNTSSLIEISPYKFDGPGGAGRPAHVQVVPMPDAYRGRYRGRDAAVGARYAAHVREAVDHIAAAGGRLAAFFSESLLSCGGQIVLPEGYLAEAYRHVRAAGGVCVADEVQVGFGRVGSHFWGFQTQDVVPDIVTMGKPIGNGHPLSAVVTTPAIAASFDDGMEYFNTFGGNPVSCAVGLAVLDVIRDEGLQGRAGRVGGRMKAALQGLADAHPIVGDVRGRGLFLGVELVGDRESRTPAGEQASYVVERMRDLGILLSTDGPDRNVIKIKPPLVFEEPDADRVVDTLDRVLRDDVLR